MYCSEPVLGRRAETLGVGVGVDFFEELEKPPVEGIGVGASVGIGVGENLVSL